MAQYISKSALVAEIERRCEVIANASNDNNRELAAIYGAQQCELINLVQFINTLEVKEEPISDDLEEAVNAYIGHAPDIDEGLLVSCKRKAFKAGAKWQKKHLIDKACVKLKKLMYDNLMFQGRLHREEVIDNFVKDFKTILKGK